MKFDHFIGSTDSDTTDYESVHIDLSDDDRNDQQPQAQASPTAAPAVPNDDDDWHTQVKKPVRLKFRGKEEVHVPTPPATTPTEFFQLFFNDDLLQNILQFTNGKAETLSHNKPQPRRSPLNKFKPLTMQELKNFLGINMLMGNIQMPTLKHYWQVKNKLYHHPIIGNTMSRNRFLLLLRSLRFYDTSKTDTSKKDKIQYVLTHLLENFQKFYSPCKQLSVDEALLGFKGRLSYKQYIPLKRSRFGIKLYELSTSSGYVLDVMIYTGKGTVMDDRKRGHGFQVVKKLMHRYRKRGHALFLDNYYTSIDLAEYLYREGTQITGTIKSNRKGIPLFVTKEPLKKGETIFARKKHLLIQRWSDKKQVFMISTRHNGDLAMVRNKFGAERLKPECVIEYNKHMGGIDRVDQITSYYTSARKTVRWQLKLFFHLMDLSLWNAAFLYNFEKPKKEKFTYLKFRDSVISNFIAERPPPSAVPATIDVESSNQHLPKKMMKRRRCRYCALKKKRSATFFFCETCSKPNNIVPLCTKNDCFVKFHKEKLYRNL